MSILENKCLTPVNVYITVYDMANDNNSEGWGPAQEDEVVELSDKSWERLRHAIKGVRDVRASFEITDGKVVRL